MRPCESFARLAAPRKSELHKINAALEFKILNTPSDPLDEQKERSFSVASSIEETPTNLFMLPSVV
jgi:hypothetical protein